MVFSSNGSCELQSYKLFSGVSSSAVLVIKHQYWEGRWGRVSIALHRPRPLVLGGPPCSLSSSSPPPADLSERLCSGQPKASGVYPQPSRLAGISPVQSLGSAARRLWPPLKFLRSHRFNRNTHKLFSVERMNNIPESEAWSFWKETWLEVSCCSATEPMLGRTAGSPNEPVAALTVRTDCHYCDQHLLTSGMFSTSNRRTFLNSAAY